MLHRYPDVSIHPSADVAESVRIGTGIRSGHREEVPEGVLSGRQSILGKGSTAAWEGRFRRARCGAAASIVTARLRTPARA